MSLKIEPVGFIRLGELLIEEEPTENHYNDVAEILSNSIRKGFVTEGLAAVTRLYTSMCYELATEYSYKEFIHAIPKLPENSLAPLNDFLTQSLSRRTLEMLVAYCDQRFSQAIEASSFIAGLLTDLSAEEPGGHPRYREFIHPRSVDEIRTLADLVVLTQQSSGWLLGRHYEERVQADLDSLITSVSLFDRSLGGRAIPPWLYFLSRLYARVVLKNVDRLSIHTIFHRHARSCGLAFDLIRQGFSILWPTQVDSVEAVLTGKDVLLVSETGTGKSLLGSMLVGSKREENGVSIYTVPTRALAYQLSRDIARLVYQGAQDRVKVLTMEEEMKKEDLESCKTIVGTYEKIEGLFRENILSANDVSLLVIDECHNIGDFGRGVTLDFLLTQLNPKFHCQRMLLSAVVPEDQGVRLAQWAKTDYVKGRDWRRTKVIEKIAIGNVELPIPAELASADIPKMLVELERVQTSRKVEYYLIPKVIELVRQGKMVLVTAESRSRVEQLAEEIGKTIQSWMDSPIAPDLQLRDRLDEGKRELYSFLAELKQSELVLPRSTESISHLLTRRVVFHHAGLPKALRTTIERMIRDRVPLVVVSTTTLEAGVNFPVDVVVVKRLAQTKIVRTLKKRLEIEIPPLHYALSRYESRLFSAYRNVIGRAGRAGFSERGESIAYFDDIDEASEFLEVRYSEDRPLGAGADLYSIVRMSELSKLNYRGYLRSVSKDLEQSRGRFLSNLLSSAYLMEGNMARILAYLKRTWLWHVISDLPFLREIDQGFQLFVSEELRYLVEIGFLTRVDENNYELTPLGSIVNSSLLDPLSAKRIEEGLKSLLRGPIRLDDSYVDFCILNIVGLAFEVRLNPLDRVSEESLTKSERQLMRRLRTLSIPNDRWSVRIASVLSRWARGERVELILTEFGLKDSDYGLLEELIPKNAVWVLHSMKRISVALGAPAEFVFRLERLTSSVSVGTDNEIAKTLLATDIPGVGRSTALFILEKFKPHSFDDLSRLKEDDFLKQFPGKEELSKRVFSQIEAIRTPSG